jgi:hypothetical protein
MWAAALDSQKNKKKNIKAIKTSQQTKQAEGGVVTD